MRMRSVRCHQVTNYEVKTQVIVTSLYMVTIAAKGFFFSELFQEGDEGNKALDRSVLQYRI